MSKSVVIFLGVHFIYYISNYYNSKLILPKLISINKSRTQLIQGYPAKINNRQQLAAASMLTEPIRRRGSQETKRAIAVDSMITIGILHRNCEPRDIRGGKAKVEYEMLDLHPTSRQR
jgi:hypothetical protein